MKPAWSYLLAVLLLIAAVALETTASQAVERARGSKSRIFGSHRHSGPRDEDDEASGRVISTGFVNRFSSLKGQMSSSTCPTSTTTAAPITVTYTEPTYSSYSSSSRLLPSSPSPPERVTYYFNDYYDNYDDDYNDGDNDLTMKQFGTGHRQSPVDAEPLHSETDDEDDTAFSADNVDNIDAVSAGNSIGEEAQFVGRAERGEESSLPRQRRRRPYRRRASARRRRRRNGQRRRRRSGLRRRRPSNQRRRRIVRRRGVPRIRGGQRRVYNLNI